MRIIGLTGRARSGKDTFAGFLVEHHGFVRIGLADPLRKFISEITGIPLADLMDGAVKEEPIDWLNGRSPRQLMQTLGTEWGRAQIGPDVWLQVAAHQIRLARQAGAPGVVIPDCRFDNEAEFVQALGGTVVRIERPGAAAVSAHVSEAGIRDDLVDEVVTNDGPLSSLALAAQVVARH